MLHMYIWYSRVGSLVLDRLLINICNICTQERPSNVGNGWKPWFNVRVGVGAGYIIYSTYISSQCRVRVWSSSV